MDLWQLKVFREIMLTGSVGQAAKNLGRTQSSISAILSKLEAGIGYQLFERRNRRLVPVPEAYYLRDEAERILQDVGYVKNAMTGKDSGLKQKVRIACMPMLAELFVPDVIGKFITEFPNCEFLVMSRHSSAIYRAVSTQRFDVGLAECMASTELVREDRITVECLVALSADDPLAQKNVVELQDLDGKPCASFLTEHFISQQINERMAAEGLHFNAQFQFQNAATSCLPLIENAMAYGVFSPLSVWLNTQTGRQSSRIVYRRMARPIYYPFAVLTPAHRPVSRTAKHFTQHFQHHLHSMLETLEKKGLVHYR
ncbi:MAG: LysR family transcriptional regulator [Rhodobacteraceae bacterium]|nr:LysR family transcriptional regulator [Paracoccaceae bacterium]